MGTALTKYDAASDKTSRLQNFMLLEIPVAATAISDLYADLDHPVTC